MKRLSWELKFGIGLLVLSLLLYTIHYTVFRDLHHIYLWGFTSFCFLPISVLVVALIINRLLASREKVLRLEKLNMLIGTFFSTAGTGLLSYFSTWDQQSEHLRRHFGSPDSWVKVSSRRAQKILTEHPYQVSIDSAELKELKSFLVAKTDFLIRMLENPNMLEHETFTDLLRAVFHLTEELACRDHLDGLPDSDTKHLAGDIKRAYSLLVREWVEYMGYLKRSYPYLFSLAVRTNPLDRHSSAIIQ